MDPSVVTNAGFTKVLTRTQVIPSDDRLWGLIVDQQPDPTEHGWWPANEPLTIIIGTAPTSETTVWWVQGRTARSDTGEPLSGVLVECQQVIPEGGGGYSAHAFSLDSGQYDLTFEAIDLGGLRCLASLEGYTTREWYDTVPRFPRSYEVDFQLEPILPLSPTLELGHVIPVYCDRCTEVEVGYSAFAPDGIALIEVQSNLSGGWHMVAQKALGGLTYDEGPITFSIRLEHVGYQMLRVFMRSMDGHEMATEGVPLNVVAAP
jgi:hypothetical protein